MVGSGTCDPQVGRFDEVIERAQVLTRLLLSDKPDATVDAFLAERRREAAREESCVLGEVSTAY